MEVKETILIVLPLVLVNLVFIVLALADLAKRKKVLGNNKMVWVLLIILVQYLGWIAYFLIGRRDE